MYWGSVRFFKHLILAGIIVLYLVLFTVILLLAGENRRLRTAPDGPPPVTGQSPAVQGAEQTPAPILGLPAAGGASPATSGDPPQSEDVPQNAPYYADLFPDLYVPRAEALSSPAAGTLYLTFDDGPSAYTARILDVLKERGIKATFFLIGKNIPGREDLVRRMAEEGHTIGLHSYSHEYKVVYASVESFLEDFDHGYRLLRELVEDEPVLFRFPGGSINAYSLSVYQGIAAEMLRRGFLYHDWNIDAGDSSGLATAQTIRDGVVGGYQTHGQGTVLLHERSLTLQALPQILEELERYGCHFDRLSSMVKPIIFAYPG